MRPEELKPGRRVLVEAVIIGIHADGDYNIKLACKTSQAVLTTRTSFVLPEHVHPMPEPEPEGHGRHLDGQKAWAMANRRAAFHFSQGNRAKATEAKEIADEILAALEAQGKR